MTPRLEAVSGAIGPVLEQELVELVDLQYVRQGGRSVLRIFLDKEGGITLGDCERLSHRIGSALDMAEVISESYVLEVSSPGLDRVLKKEKDFVRFSGHGVDIRLRDPIGGQRNFRGILKGVEEGRVLLLCGPEIQRLPFEEIEEARLNPEIKFQKTL